MTRRRESAHSRLSGITRFVDGLPHPIRRSVIPGDGIEIIVTSCCVAGREVELSSRRIGRAFVAPLNADDGGHRIWSKHRAGVSVIPCKPKVQLVQKFRHRRLYGLSRRTCAPRGFATRRAIRAARPRGAVNVQVDERRKATSSRGTLQPYVWTRWVLRVVQPECSFDLRLDAALTG